jgi:hypothetical protein
VPPWTNLITKYCFDPEDLPIPHGPNVVVIEAFDTEQHEDFKTKQAKTRHLMRLAGWEHPVRLNNTRIKILQAMFGANTEDAIGKKIAMMVMAGNNFGDVELTLMIHPVAVPMNTPAVPVPYRLSVTNPYRKQIAASVGVQIETPQPTLPSGGGFRTVGGGGGGGGAGGGAGMGGGGQQPPTIHAPIGLKTAAIIVATLERKGKTWDDVVSHLRLNGLGEAVAGKMPADVSGSLLPMIRTFAAEFPNSRDVDIPSRAAAIEKSWMPPPPPPPPPAAAPDPSASRGIVIDPKTGEVLSGSDEPNPDDDIPF